MSASNIVAAGGANASAFGPTAACPSIFHIFSVTDSRRTVRVLKRHTQFPREHESPSAQLGASWREGAAVVYWVRRDVLAG